MIRRKRISSYCLLCLLLVYVVGLGFTYTASAYSWVWAPGPLTDKPIITLLTPRNYASMGNQTTILFNVAMPSTWEQSLPGHNVGPTLWGTIRNVTCTLDQKQFFFDDTVYGRDAKPVLIGSTTVFPKNYPISINYSCSVNQISVGPHSLTIYVAADTFCMNWERIIDGYHYPQNIYCDVSTNENFSFDVDALSITNLSIENKTYYTSYLPLTYDINGTATWIGFSLDDQANVTIYGNYTLTDLTEGKHSIVVYANDTFGNMGKSETVTFTVAKPFPTALVAVAVLASAVAVGAGLLLYLKKHKR